MIYTQSKKEKLEHFVQEPNRRGYIRRKKKEEEEEYQKKQTNKLFFDMGRIKKII